MTHRAHAKRGCRGLGLAAVALLGCAACAVPRWPVAAPVISPFGVRREGGWLPRLHEGVDLGAPAETPVHALLDGRVRFAGQRGGWGRVVLLEHPGGWTSVYAHLAAVLVRTGERVRRGQPIGRVGQSGNATTPHLHFELWRHGRPVDPVAWLGPPRP
jgi:murein DD-endopeptidase MepM/ murein hydrolase activator NlpD